MRGLIAMTDSTSFSPTLYTYIVKTDQGSAPNPFYGICTLAICKPKIRKGAQIGDWVAGFTSKRSGQEPGRLVYVMRVDDILTLRDYDILCRAARPGGAFANRIPDLRSTDRQRHKGDCVWDYSSAIGDPIIRPSVHTEKSRDRDLGGKNVLIATRYWYFGDRAKPLDGRRNLAPIVPTTQGHRGPLNREYASRFIDWIESLALCPGMHGNPEHFGALGDCDDCEPEMGEDDKDGGC
jgi:hypothetical protein